MSPRVAGIVLAAGQGARYGAPKQFLELGGATLVDHSVAVTAQSCDEVVLVIPAGVVWRGAPVAAVVAGGATRSASVRAGLTAVTPAAEIVVVHDAARPLAPAGLFEAVIDAVRSGADGAIPALPVADTLKRVEGSEVVATIPRDGLVAVQTPQAFRAECLRAAHAGSDDATDDAALVERAGGTVIVVPGDVRNIKITGPGDLALAETLLAAGGA